MRLKEDSSSYRAMGLAKKYAPVKERPVKSRKNTTKWCKGKVGVEHDYEYEMPKNDSIIFRMIPVCQNCGKQDYRDVMYWCRHHEEWEEHPSWNHGI